VLRVAGPEAVAYLHGQLSQDVEGLAVGDSAPTLLLAPSGKLDAWLRMTRLADDSVLLDAPAPSADPIAARLERFKLRTKAEIEVLEWSVVAVRGPGAVAAAHEVAGPHDLVLQADWPGIEGADLLGPAPELPAGAEDVGPDGLEGLRIAAGVPRLGCDLGPDTIPAEAGAWVVDGAVDFTKGCFTGQELVARIDSRGGNVPRPLRVLRIDGDEVPEPGATVRAADSTTVGRITSAATHAEHGALAMGPLSRSVEPGASVVVAWDGRDVPATVEPTPLG
jgi:tRNA-modifying protein YgfZ